MKKDKVQQLRAMTVLQLNKKLHSLNEEIAKLNLDLKTGKLKNLHKVKFLRKERAVIKTLLTEKDQA